MRTLAILLLLVLLAACGGQGDTQQAAQQAVEEVGEQVGEQAGEETGTMEDAAAQALDETQQALVTRAAAIANALAKAPENTEAIFQQYNTTAADFEALLYSIAQDPALSAAYEKARAEG